MIVHACNTHALGHVVGKVVQWDQEEVALSVLGRRSHLRGTDFILPQSYRDFSRLGGTVTAYEAVTSRRVVHRCPA